MPEKAPPYIALIDGDCGLCRATQAWVEKRDKKSRFEFHPLESPEGQKWLKRSGMPVGTRDTMVLVEGETPYVRSTAVLRMVRRVRPPWPLLYAFIAVPRPLRDWAYRFIAKHRRHIRLGRGGEGESCALPTKSKDGQ